VFGGEDIDNGVDNKKENKNGFDFKITRKGEI